MDIYYRLDNGKPVQCDFQTWLRRRERDQEWRVALDNIGDRITVSTVFLGINHRFGDGPPILFETMIFGGKHDQYQERYSTLDEAVAGHKRAVLLASDLP